MKRDPRLKKLSWDHHHGLVMSLRIERELADPLADIGALYADLLAFWSAGLLPHFRVETECLLARLIRHLPESHESVRRTQDDHLGIAALVSTMRDTKDAAGRRETLARFGTTLKDHIRWEELVLFQQAQDELSTVELEALEVEIEAALER